MMRRRWRASRPLLAGAALTLGALVLWIIGAAGDRAIFLQSYLWAYLFWLNVALGSLGLLLMHDLTGGRWLGGIGAWLHGAARTLPALAVAFVPLAAGMASLWPWADEHANHDPHLLARSAYLNGPFFLVRAVACFAVWSLLAWRIAGRAGPGVSGAGLVLFVLSVTFAAFDWGMSLQPDWYSTIYGIVFITSQAVAALSAAVLASALGVQGPTSRVQDVSHDQGNLLLAFVTLWAYIAFSQWLIIWSGNLPEEVTWYLPRLRGAWGGTALTLIVLHFAVPFFLLLNRPVKRRRRALAAVAALLLAMQMLHMAWLILPSLRPGLDWRDPLAVIALGGAWIACCLWLIPAPTPGGVHWTEGADATTGP
jgi:hypothetical protein